MHPKQQQREDVVEKRAQWVEMQENFDPEKLIFLDESSINCAATRIYGRAPKGERVEEYVPYVKFERTSIISAMGLSGVIAPLAFKGTLNGALFKQYVDECLAPCLKPGDIVIMDNLSSHKVAGVLDAIHKRGAKVQFIPPYSPDLNPIELAWSKMKSTVRRLKPRVYDELLEALGIAFSEFTEQDILSWFSHCAYE